jgi:hypothetical protein
MAGKHRKIYEQHYGPIGKDTDGRSLEVHHINGDHSDNRIENLTLVTINEHYKIHKAQKDWGACFLMGERMNLSPEELSDLSRKTQLARVEAGTHHLLGPDNNNNRIKEGTHPFLDKDAARARNNKRVNAGTHNLLKRADGSSQSGDRVKAGKHHFVKNNPVNNLLAKGTHASKIKLSCVFCRKQCSKNNFNKQHKNCGVKILPVNV